MSGTGGDDDGAGAHPRDRRPARPGGDRGAAAAGLQQVPGDPSGEQVHVPPRGCFVVGMARSGTTLVRSLLDSHPAVYAVPEETFVAEWCKADDPVSGLFEDRPYRLLFEQGSPGRRYVEQRLRERLPGPTDVASALHALIEVLQQWQPEPGNQQVWIEKTPRHVQHIGPLRRAFGEATRVVGLVRDPRAVLASINRFMDRDEQGDLRRFARQWATTDRILRAWAEALPERMLLVRYEDLVAEPEPVLRRLSALLDIPWDAAVLRPTTTTGKWGAVSRGGEPGAAINTRSLTKYREQLEPETIRRLEELLAPRMLAWGYELDHPRAVRRSFARLRLEVQARRKARGRLPD